MSPNTPAGRVLLLVGLLVLTVAACGRRGPLEAPGAQGVGASAPSGTTVEPEEDRRQAGAIGAPAPGGRNAPRRGFTVPKDPFILDPLL